MRPSAHPQLRNLFSIRSPMHIRPATRFTRGFSLVELVTVIILLGILAAFALPRLLDLRTSARTAVVTNFAGSLRAGVMMVHGACVATPGCISSIAEDKTVVIDGKTFALWANYPNGGVPLGVASADTIVDASGFQVTATGTSGFINTVFQLSTAPDPATCSVTYTEASSLTVPPVIQTTTTGC